MRGSLVRMVHAFQSNGMRHIGSVSKAHCSHVLYVYMQHAWKTSGSFPARCTSHYSDYHLHAIAVFLPAVVLRYTKACNFAVSV